MVPSLYLNAQRTSALVLSLTHNILPTITRTYHKEHFFYEERYKGIYDGHNQAINPRRLHPYKEEELLDEIHAIRAKEVDKPSPFHVITRIKGPANERLSWTEKVTLRRLNIHSTYNGDVSVIPNTPQFNDLIEKVKHLIVLKPVVFENGKLPTEEDIGALKVCPQTGVVRIDEKLRLREKRVNLLPPMLFRGNQLRFKLGRQIGLYQNHYLK